VGEPPVRRQRLTFRRLSGLDRSGPPPPETVSGAPLHPWTIPNFIGYIRLALIPVFLGVQLSSDSGTEPLGAVLFAVIGWSDYLDGIAARVTGQYSRMGALLDPVVDRLLVISGVVVCWNFALLPRWALAVLAARELLMLVLARIALSRGVELKINWLGRWGVWPVFGALFFAMCAVHWLALIFLYAGLALTLAASALYVRDGLKQVEGQGSTSA
jgi:CDP-diacylglycerol--glycerol-3-phosphate 3-phosphatidyltransferase